MLAPYGMNGGEEGLRGKNLYRNKEGTLKGLPSKVRLMVEAGESIRILTPGGGGYGKVV